MMPGASGLLRGAVLSHPSSQLTGLRVGGVSYLNAAPVLHGLAQRMRGQSLVLEVPSVLARGLADGALDLALAPVASLAASSDLRIAPRVCIGCDGPVASVLIVSERPIEDLSTLLLDSSSRTSVVLAQLVTTHLRGGRALATEPANDTEMRRRVGEDVGAVVIGDRAFEMAGRYRHVLDLGAAWREWTGLPFVFAAWVARRRTLDAATQAVLEDSLASGLEARPAIAAEWALLHGGRATEFHRYLTRNIQYRMDERYEAGLAEFFGRAVAAGLLPPVASDFVEVAA